MSYLHQTEIMSDEEFFEYRLTLSDDHFERMFGKNVIGYLRVIPEDDVDCLETSKGFFVAVHTSINVHTSNNDNVIVVSLNKFSVTYDANYFAFLTGKKIYLHSRPYYMAVNIR